MLWWLDIMHYRFPGRESEPIDASKYHIQGQFKTIIRKFDYLNQPPWDNHHMLNSLIVLTGFFELSWMQSVLFDFMEPRVISQPITILSPSIDRRWRGWLMSRARRKQEIRPQWGVFFQSISCFYDCYGTRLLPVWRSIHAADGPLHANICIFLKWQHLKHSRHADLILVG